MINLQQIALRHALECAIHALVHAREDVLDAVDALVVEALAQIVVAEGAIHHVLHRVVMMGALARV